MPDFTLVETPPPPGGWLENAGWFADELVWNGALPEALASGVGALKLFEVTLKHGTLTEKSFVSTKV
jgi:hypothetical protein